MHIYHHNAQPGYLYTRNMIMPYEALTQNPKYHLEAPITLWNPQLTILHLSQGGYQINSQDTVGLELHPHR